MTDVEARDPATDEQVVASYDFGIVETVQIGNRVWTETDGNGVADDAGDNTQPVENAVVTATASNGTTYTATTDANGLYTITVPANATYTVTLDAPAGYDPSTIIVSGTDSDPLTNNDENHNHAGAVVTVTTEDNLTIDFGFTPKMVEIGNLVWLESDTDGNATTNQTDVVVGALVKAMASGGAVYTATTDANGLYTITVPANATYTVTVATPDGYTPSGTLINASSSPADTDNLSHDGSGTAVTVAEENNYTIDFGFTPITMEIGNRVWIEDDADGDATTGNVTPVPNTIVTATASGGAVYTATTDANGFYTITVPANATYTVTVGTPAGTSPSNNAAATEDTPNDGDDTNHDGSGTVVTVTDVDNHTVDFGFTSADLYAIGNLVWIDGEPIANGQYNPGTDTLADGVTVNLYRVVGGNVESTPFMTTTTVNGAYQFAGLLAGTYEVGIPASEFRTVAGGGTGTLVDPMNTPYGVVGPNSQGTDSTDDNGDHNTIYPVANDTFSKGVRSNQITLGDGAEPTGEPNYGLTAVVPDDRSDWTVDFAFAERDATAVGMAGSADASQLTLFPVRLAALMLTVATIGLSLRRRRAID